MTVRNIVSTARTCGAEREQDTKPSMTTRGSAWRQGAVAASLSLCAGVLLGHDTWVVPAAPRVQPGAALVLNLTSGMSFPTLDHPIQLDRLQHARIRVGGKSYEVSKRSPGKNALALTIRPSHEGVAAIWIDSKPKFIALKPAEVKEYLDEIGAADTIGKEWSAGGADRPWRENYTKHAKTFVAVGSASDKSWAAPVGMALEFVPESDPTRLAVGSELSVQLLREGEPLSDFPVGMVGSDPTLGKNRKTDSKGRVSFRLERKGWVMFRATEIRPAKEKGADWESHFSTLTVYVD